MRHLIARWMALASIVVTGFSPVAGAQEGSKALPTLLIKGEIVSVEQTDPAAPLLKVKDRYGFETPIYLGEETKIARADQALAAADLTQGLAVEVEYNFDINTAKRHAVNVKVTADEAPAAPAAQPAEAPALTTGEAALELTEEPVAPDAAPDAEAESAPVASDETVPAAESSGETPPQ